MSIKAILYSKFDPSEGPKIVHQVPEDSVLTSTDVSNSAANAKNGSNGDSSNTSALLSFSTVSRFLIPRQALCGNLISLTPPPLTPASPSTIILGYPVCIQSTHYPRNEFIFNFALVLSPPDSIDIPSYKSVVTKLAHLMRSLEEQSYFLSDDSSAPNSGKIYSLCEMLMEDLNNYCECMIPIDEFNTLNIKLFPTLPDPAPVRPWHVPLFTVRIETLMDENWDLTMQRIIPFINGINSVKRIAGLADADIKFTKKCIRHLLYYGCVLLLDIFSFNAIYAPTAEFTGMIASDLEMQAECARYVNTAFEPARQDANMSSSVVAAGGVGTGGSETGMGTSMRSSVLGNASSFSGVGGSVGVISSREPSSLTTMMAAMTMEEDFWPLAANGDLVDGVTIVQLFASLKQGLTVREWYAQNSNSLANIDVRRFITFGIIKGFLYRIHRYAIQTLPTTPTAATTTTAAATSTAKSLTTTRPKIKQQHLDTKSNGAETPTRAEKKPQIKNTRTNVSNNNRNNSGTANESQPPRRQQQRPRRTDKPISATTANNNDNSDDNVPGEEGEVAVQTPEEEPEQENHIQTLLFKYLDGTHCFDEICTDLCISEKELMARLAVGADMGEVVVICR